MYRPMLPLVLWGCAALVLPGCLHQDQDHVVANTAAELAALPRDGHARSVLNTPRPKPFTQEKAPMLGKDKLQLPEGLPVVDSRPITVPPLDPKNPQDPKRDKAIQALYPALPPVDDQFKPLPGPGGQPLDLQALEQMALASNPIVRQAAADVQAARGVAIQAGLYPNPTIGFQGDSIGQSGPTGQAENGQLGGFFDQTIKTGGKLELARAAGLMDVRSSQLALRRAQIDVMSQVRTAYFDVLVTQESLAIAKAMFQLSNEVYQLQVKTVQGGQAAAYEPVGLRALAAQARQALNQAQNHYVAAWRTLAATLGQLDMPPTQLAGNPDVVVPAFDYQAVRDHVLANNTEIGTATTGIVKARYLLQLAQATPCPDLLTHFVVENDTTAAPNRVMVGVQVGFGLPVWDRNQGGILAAQAQLAKANSDVARVEIDLAQKLADAYERYQTNTAAVALYRDSILGDLIRVYRATYQRYQQQPDKVLFTDIVVAQQTLSQALQTYVQALGEQWKAIVDLATLLQTDDIYQLTTPVLPCIQPLPVCDMLNSRTWTVEHHAPHAVLTGVATVEEGQAATTASVSRPKLLPPTDPQ